MGISSKSYTLVIGETIIGYNDFEEIYKPKTN